MTKPIVVVGSINLDLVAMASHFPSPGETVTGRDFQTFFGGKGANQAVAAAKLGYPVTMIGKVGEDAFGVQLVDALKRDGVETSRIERASGASGVALIITDDKGENSIVVVPGANGQLKPSDIERNKEVLSKAGIILAQLEIPLETVEALGRIAREQNVPLILDPAPARSLPHSILRNLSWITPNEVEAGQLLNSSGQSLSESEAADRLLAAGVEHVVLKLGPRGSLVAEDEKRKTLVPGYAVKAIDTTAAGDAFNGAFAVALLRSETAVEAARYANAVAAISVTRRGAQPSMPSGEEVARFLEQVAANKS